MRKFRNRLSLIFICVIGLSNVVAALFTISVMRNSQIQSLEDGMREQAQIYLASVDWNDVSARSVGGEMFRTEADRIARKMDSHVSFFDTDGKLLAESNRSVGKSGENDPPEIQAARGKAAGTAIRRDENGNKMMYVAVPASFGKAGTGFVRFGESLSKVDVETRRIASYLGLGLLVILVATALLAHRISHNLTGPLEKITRVARQITDMNYKARVTIPNRDEIGQLGQAINQMSESLQIQMKQIQEDESRLKNVLENMISGVLMIDHNERVVLMNRSAEELLGLPVSELLLRPYNHAKMQTELIHMIQMCLVKREHIRDEAVFYYPKERTLDIHLVPMSGEMGAWGGIVIVLHDISDIRRLERVRSEFVANVSHELKTPIAAVKGFAETLLGGAVNDPATARTFLQIIYDESERLNRLIGDILDLSKFQSKQTSLQFSPIELKPFISNVFELIAAEAAKKRITLEARIEEGIYIEADEDRLRQIMINLLSNGITYSLDEGKVRVSVEPVFDSGELSDEYDSVKIVVEDYGIGIPKKDLPRIFERFYRVDKARTRASGGTGLGLSIVKHLVELHNGTIRAESAVGAGSRFIVVLPVLQQ